MTMTMTMTITITITITLASCEEDEKNVPSDCPMLKTITPDDALRQAVRAYIERHIYIYIIYIHIYRQAVRAYIERRMRQVETAARANTSNASARMGRQTYNWRMYKWPTLYKWQVCTCRPHACIRVSMHACEHACVCVCMRVCMHACVRACVCACVRVCMRACVHACVCAWMHACVHACRCLSVHACTALAALMHGCVCTCMQMLPQ